MLRHTPVFAAVSLALAGTTLSLHPVPAQAEPTIAVKDVVLTVGSNSGQRNLTWLGGTGVDDYVQLVRHQKGKALSWKAAKLIRPFSAATAGEETGWEYNKVALTGLKAGVTYSYRVCTATSCADEHRFKTAKAGSFSFLAYGDPQVYLGTKTGQNGVVENPSEGWAATLTESVAKVGDAAFLMTAGDNVDSYTISKQPGEWDAFLAPSQVAAYPLAPTVGNHDNASNAGYLYNQHFALPNVSNLGTTAAGTGDYWYTYNGVLFMTLNTNSLDFAAHTTFLKQAIKANPKATWRVVTLHHSPFSSADHPNDADVTAIRTTLTPVFSALKVNVVIGGHDHDYTRSYLMNGDKIASSSAGASLKPKRGQVLYVALNSASGGKFYDLTGPYAWAAVKDQSLKANYTAVKVTATHLVVTTYEVGGRVIDQVSLARTH
jgi:3',5'-cyclic AMP phosphodiesterase CpdA